MSSGRALAASEPWSGSGGYGRRQAIIGFHTRDQCPQPAPPGSVVERLVSRALADPIKARRDGDTAGFPSCSQWQVHSGACCLPMHAFWSRRGCGIACLQAILLHRLGLLVPLVELSEEVLAAGGYVMEDHRVGGLRYPPLVGYLAERWGIRAAVAAPMSTAELVTWLDEGAIAMAAMHRAIHDAPSLHPRAGGQVVAVWRHHAGLLSLMNPGEAQERRRRVRVRVDMFDRCYARRAVLIYP